MTPKHYGKGTPAKVLAFLRSQTEPLSVAEIAAAMGPKISRRNVFDAMPVLMASGLVVRSGSWNLYRYACKGKEDGS